MHGTDRFVRLAAQMPASVSHLDGNVTGPEETKTTHDVPAPPEAPQPVPPASDGTAATVATQLDSQQFVLGPPNVYASSTGVQRSEK